MRQRAMLAALFCSLLASAAAQASDVYKMVDKSGRVHYSDTPQPGWNRVNITPVPATPSTDPAKAAEQAQREENCALKMEELQRYRAAVTIKEKDALGNVHEYSASERQQLIDSTQKEADGLCAAVAASG